jgi:SAM-dependent methyltransferase
MQAYYDQRAHTYERIYHKPERQRDLRAIEAWLPTMFVGRRVLEVAAGTGWWTVHGSRDATHWLATDINESTLNVARRKPMPRRDDGQSKVGFAVMDAHTLGATLGGQRFDAAFAGFWWSHLPQDILPAWLAQLHAQLLDDARVVFLDNRFVEGSSTPIHRRDAQGNTFQMRTLDDGSSHEVLKNFPSCEDAVGMLGHRARDIHWIEHPHYWVLSYRWARA